MGKIVKFRRPHRGPFTAHSRRRRSSSLGISLVLTVILSASAVAAAALFLEGWFFANTQAPTAKPAPSTGTIVGRASVIDGDTIEIDGRRIRLHGIDAPESGQSCRDGTEREYQCGRRAALALSDKVGQQAVSCQQRDVDRYGRIVAVCRASNEDLNGWLVSRGWAMAYRRYGSDYIEAEDEARAAKRGIWAGRFTTPEEWRHGKKGEIAKEQPSSADRAATCAIKGNISRSGERIYHGPGGKWYERTKINPSNGERWFCSEAAAKAAGWRRAK